MAQCCCIGCAGGSCTGTCYACTACGVSCADSFCGGCLTGASPLAAACDPCSPSCVPDPGSPAPLCSLPLTNPNQDPSLDPLTSPCSHGATDLPPSTSANAHGSGGGSGSGMSASSQGGKSVPRPAQSTSTTLLSSLLNKLGTVTGSVAQKNRTIAGQKIVPSSTVSNFSYVLVILVVGGLLWMIVSSKSA